WSGESRARRAASIWRKDVKFTSRESFATDPTTTKTARNSTSLRSSLRKFDSSAAQMEKAKENNLRKSIQTATTFRFRANPKKAFDGVRSNTSLKTRSPHHGPGHKGAHIRLLSRARTFPQKPGSAT